jgi:hypothetical protein
MVRIAMMLTAFVIGRMNPLWPGRRGGDKIRKIRQTEMHGF